MVGEAFIEDAREGGVCREEGREGFNIVGGRHCCQVKWRERTNRSCVGASL